MITRSGSVSGNSTSIRQTAHVCTCYYIVAGGYAYAYVIAGGYVSACDRKWLCKIPFENLLYHFDQFDTNLTFLWFQKIPENLKNRERVKSAIKKIDRYMWQSNWLKWYHTPVILLPSLQPSTTFIHHIKSKIHWYYYINMSYYQFSMHLAVSLLN